MHSHPTAAAALGLLLLSGCGVSASGVQSSRELRIADVALASGDGTAALEIAQRIVAENPHDVDALVRLGNAQTELGQADLADGSFRRALEIDGGTVAASLGLARLHLQSDANVAKAELVSLAASNPRDPKVLTDLGVAEDLLGEHEAAQLSYRQVLALRPGSLCAEVDLGLSLAMSGNAGSAVAMLAPLASAPEASPKIRQDYAVAVALAGRTEDARAILQHDLPAEQVVQAVDAFRGLEVSSR